MLDLTGVDLMTVVDEIVAIVPQILPAILGLIALRKGMSFLFSALRGA